MIWNGHYRFSVAVSISEFLTRILMQSIEHVLAVVLTIGIMGYLIFVRLISPLFSQIHEIQRPDKPASSPIQGVFSEPNSDSDEQPSEFQTLFPK
jgi:hypothetical protein